MIKYALFLGCNIPARVEQYDISARKILKKLNVDLVDIRMFKCCGYPMRNINEKAFLFSSVQNLALAEKKGLDMLVLCKCCYGSLKKAEHLMKKEGVVQKEARQFLAQEGLEYEGKTKVKHLLSVLYHDVGIKTIKNKISKPFKGLNIATHYGCHVLRPNEITQFDNPVAPLIFDELVELTGAKSVDWVSKLECCGAPVMGINDDLSMSLTKKKITNGKKAGAHYLASACPYCHLQFDTVQDMMIVNTDNDHLASILYPQLLGLSMGLDKKKLGIEKNSIDISGITSFLKQE